MSDKSIKYVDDYLSLGFTQCRIRVTLSHSACNATRCSAMKLPKLNRHLDGRHPELKEKTSLFPKKKNLQSTTVNCAACSWVATADRSLASKWFRFEINDLLSRLDELGAVIEKTKPLIQAFSVPEAPWDSTSWIFEEWVSRDLNELQTLWFIAMSIKFYQMRTKNTFNSNTFLCSCFCSIIQFFQVYCRILAVRRVQKRSISAENVNDWLIYEPLCKAFI